MVMVHVLERRFILLVISWDLGPLQLRQGDELLDSGRQPASIPHEERYAVLLTRAWW